MKMRNINTKNILSLPLSYKENLYVEAAKYIKETRNVLCLYKPTDDPRPYKFYGNKHGILYEHIVKTNMFYISLIMWENMIYNFHLSQLDINNLIQVYITDFLKIKVDDFIMIAPPKRFSVVIDSFIFYVTPV